MTFNEELALKVEYIETVLEKLLPEEEGYAKTVIEAMNYSIKAGGKRLRPLIMNEVYSMFGGSDTDMIESFMTALNQRNSEFEYIRLLDERIFMCVPDSMVTELSQNDSDVAHELESKRIPVDDFKSGKSADRTYSPVNASIFKNSRFILLEDGTNVRAMSNSFFDSWGYYPQMPVEVSQMLTGYQLCLSGAGVTFLPESILKYGNFRDSPVIYAIDDSLSHREMYACSKKSRYISSACQEFIELLKKMLAC